MRMVEKEAYKPKSQWPKKIKGSNFQVLALIKRQHRYYKNSEISTNYYEIK